MDREEFLKEFLSSCFGISAFSPNKNDFKIPSLLSVRFRGGHSKLDGVPSEQKIVETTEYVEIPFRILSASYIESHFLDLSGEGVLERAKNLFKTRVLKDHLVSIDSVIGDVQSVSYALATETVPSGVEGVYRIYKKFAPAIVDKLMMTPPLISSTSAGIRIEWKQSHESMNPFDFMWQLGQVVDGEIVRIVVTEIVNVFEVSLVYEGADKFAKKLNDIFFDKKSENTDLKIEIIEEVILKINKLQALSVGMSDSEIVKLGLDKTESVEVKQEDFDVLVAKLSVLQNEKKLLDEKVERESNLVTLGLAYETEVREEALKNYRAVYLESQDETIIELLKSAPLESVKGLNRAYVKQLELNHPLKNESRQSGVESVETEKVSNENVDEYKVRT